MGDGGAFNVRDLLRQLGIKDVSELPILKAIQPTLTVGDGSGLTAPLIPKTVAFGWNQAPAAGEYAAVRVVGGPTGCWIRYAALICQTANQGNWILSATATAEVALSGTDLVPHNMGFEPSGATARRFNMLTAAAPASGTNPYFRIAANQSFLLPDVVHVPPGWVWEAVQRSSVSSHAFGGLIVAQDAIASLTPSG